MHKLLTLVCMMVIGLNQSAAQSAIDRGIKHLKAGDDFLARFQPAEAQAEYLQAIDIASTIHHDSLYAVSLFGAGQATWYAGNFAHAVDTVNLALSYFEKGKHPYNHPAALRILSNIYDDMGDYVHAFATVRKALEMFEHYDDSQNHILSLIQMGSLYKSIGDMDAALEFYNKAWERNPPVGEYPYRELNHCMGEIYMASNMPDSALFYYHNAQIGNPESKIIRLRIGELYLQTNQPDKAYAQLFPLYQYATQKADIIITMGAMLGLVKIYQVRNEWTQAQTMALTVLSAAEQRGARQYSRDACQLLSRIYEAQGDATKALYYEKRFGRTKDSIISDQLKGQLYSFKQQLGASRQSAAMQSLTDSKRVAQRTVLIILLCAALICFFLVARNKNEKLRFSKIAAELEMKALRAQMNPHFIFNCLTAINHFILNKEEDRASIYLTRFSRLIRMVLNNAGKPVISMEEELDMLRRFLDMEQLRFKDAFEYYIYWDPAIQPSMVQFPSFLLQPFCENAIWHGLMHKEGHGQLDIYFTTENGYLVCTIKDNGVGREKAAALDQRGADKDPSLGLALTTQRLILFNGSNKPEPFTISDIKDDSGHIKGTLVTLRINIKNAYD
ncbi:MAG: histidine kinase [Bacteroidota bacterium]